MDIVVTNQITPTFTQIGPLCLNSTAPALPTTSNNNITGTWSPATINTSTIGTTTYTFTPDAGQCGTTTTMDIVITNQITPTFTQIGPLCLNSAAPALPAASANGINGTWNPATINTSTAGTTTYTFTPDAGQCGTTTTMDIVINNQITPTFTAVAPICSGLALAPLPTTSTNGITGTWAPALNNTTTTTYTFTPDPGQCATTTTLTITVNLNTTPTFTQVGPLCLNSTAPALPTTSSNGINGTWNPATINTSTIGTTSYTFTPDAGQCTAPVTMDIVVSNQITPTFTQIGPLCLNSTAPILPTVSVNGISGTWNPATISTSTIGTTTYTFIPDAGQCGTTATMDIVITNQITPTFAQIGPLCLNSAVPALPTTSINNITGTWNPATINTATAGTTTYTFTPAAGQCGTTITMDIVITNQITPTFTAVAPICSGAALTPLPTTSNNGITGTWAPALSNTATTTYTFTPDPGQCATTTTLTITVNPNTTPSFAQIGPLCLNSAAPALPTTSTNNITGTWNPATINAATAGTTTYTFTPDAGQCGATTTMDIVITNQITPVFTQIGPLCLNSAAPALPTTSINNITGTWNPATINTATAGTTTYTFTPDAGQCGTTTTMDIVITNQITPTFTQIGPLCLNSAAPALPTTSINNITGTWNPATINTATAGTTTYTFTPDAGQCGATTTMDIVITNQITPAFTQIGPLCLNSAAPALPTTSTNNITGTWNPATINTSTAGTTTYTFTPAAGQCGTTVTMDIVITNQITPVFTQIGPLCLNSAAPALPTTSTNNITGTWNPATINTATAGTTTYTFTPAAGQCGTTATMDIVITSQITPTFTQIGPLCLNSAAPALPTTSTNNITGTWNPTTINTATAGTTTYTFTPDAGQCGTTVTMDIVITNQITPTFTQIGPLCLNSTAPALPTTSNNNITGTWNPATINTATAGTTTYTFTPTAGQCGTTVTMDIVITNQITPTFTQIGPLCLNSAAPALPTTSTNNITGTWNPATINTATAGTTTYTFTPDAGQCGTTATMDIVITNQITPVFTQIGPLCLNSAAPVLPAVSSNNITGTWNPATINTSTAGTTTYTFTPAAGQCGTTATMDIVITNQITPIFTQIGPLCLNSAAPALPTTSTNNITGTWNPATINTATAGTITYTFTPDAGQCGTTATMDIVITNQITPTFTQIGPLCLNSTAPALPAVSVNGINGTWNPATINTATAGSTTYTFTPTAGQCGTTTTMDIVITNQITPTFAQIGPLCLNSAAPALPTTSTNNITGTWNPATINTSTTGTTTYTFTPDAGQCGTTTTMDIVITNQITPTFTQIGPLCPNSAAPALPTTSTNNITGNWNPATISTTASGTYAFTPVVGQCATPVTMDIVINTSSLILNISDPPPVCAPATIDLTAPAVTAGSDAGLIYTYWTDVANTIPIANPAAISTSGTYYIKATSAGGCSISKPVLVEVTQTIQSMRYPDLTTDPNVSLQLTARNPGNNYTYNWAPLVGLDSYTTRTPIFNYDKETEYIIKITSGSGCLIVDTLLVKMRAITSTCVSDVLVPKAWSPNGDGHNDKLFPLPVCIKELKYFRIFNRWGKLMFETNILNNGWDGIYNGQPQVMDVYTWTVEAVGLDGRYVKRAGTSVLLR
jgi:gliding motility-associated-like protein